MNLYIKFNGLNISSIKFFSDLRNKKPDMLLMDMCREFIKVYRRCATQETEEERSLEEDEDSHSQVKLPIEVKKEEPLPVQIQPKAVKSIVQSTPKTQKKNFIKAGATKNEPLKTSFISLKMEIDTALMFKLLIVLMIFTIAMIIIFLLRIEFRPLLNYQIPKNYYHETIQPPYYNVKKYNIYNKYTDMPALFDVKKPEVKSAAQEIKDEVKNDMEAVVDTTTKSEGFKSECFSSNYEFGI